MWCIDLPGSNMVWICRIWRVVSLSFVSNIMTQRKFMKNANQKNHHEYKQMFWNLSSHKNLQTNQYKKVLTNVLQTKPAALTILKLTLLKYSTIHIKTFCQPRCKQFLHESPVLTFEYLDHPLLPRILLFPIFLVILSSSTLKVHNSNMKYSQDDRSSRKYCLAPLLKDYLLEDIRPGLM